MTCHVEVRKETEAIHALASLPREAKPFGLKPLYRVPDFVFFSHGRHGQAGVECASCHGAVYEQDARVLFYPTTMKGCVDCHKARNASVSCTICHELNQ